MLKAMKPAGFLLLLVLAFCGAGAGVEPAIALDEQAAKHVGGELARYGEKLAALRNASFQVWKAAPGAFDELAAAWDRVAAAPTTRGFGAELGFSAGALGLLALVVLAVRRATRHYRLACVNDPLRARGAAGLLGLDTLDRVAIAAVAYLLIEVWCDIDATQDLVAVALLWAFVRWWITMLMVQALLRPRLPQFRLIPMRDDTAVALTRIAAFVFFVGIFSISLMPVLLRVQMPIPSAQSLVLMQGLIVAAGGLLGLAIYRRRERARAEPTERPGVSALPHAGEGSGERGRFWFAAGLFAMIVVWAAWSVGTLLLNFSVYHSLVWSLRIAAFAYIIDAILCMSATAQQFKAAGGRSGTPFSHMWILLLHKSIRVAAILAIAILLAETWLVKELGVIAHAGWEPIRGSLVTAALTLLAGYVAWSYLSQWTEYRLQSAVPLLGGAEEVDNRAPASRLTTILPVLRILLGITIIVLATLVALAQLGVNIGPLLAGAGVIGLAISFGSQALVRDIVAGIFFISDDAFRVGEYIDTGRLKGTVEKISLRSMRLRHQNGQIHTIPFGQLTSITNFSRDWQTVKFNLRLTRDADIERVRRAVKQIGLEMMQDPEVAKELLQPLKLQGVAEIAENAIVVRLKFTARPVKPNYVQREALKRIYKVFPEKGIEFSSNAVTVQTAGQAPVSLESAGAAGAFNSAARRTADAA